MYPISIVHYNSSFNNLLINNKINYMGRTWQEAAAERRVWLSRLKSMEKCRINRQEKKILKTRLFCFSFTRIYCQAAWKQKS